MTRVPATGGSPVDGAEFAALMVALGPFGAGRRVAVAVSGGGDSMALVLLAAGWGDARALIVDHGLRPEAAAEAAVTADRLAARGIAARILRLRLMGGAGMPARARAARYAALEAACREEGFVHLLLGHQLGDQAETRLMREGKGSGPAGLAGMAAIVEGPWIRLVRPLLEIPPARLRATLRQAGLPWAEDPTNEDRNYLRPRLRHALAGANAAAANAAMQAGIVRRRAEAAVAALLAERATLHEAGFAHLAPGPIAPAALAALIQAIAGEPYPPSPAATAALAAAPRPATLGGARLLPAGSLGPGWIVLREQAAIAGPVPARDGAVWDGRFRLSTPDAAMPAGATVAALGTDASGFRRARPWPAAVLATLPAIRHDGRVIAVPHLVTQAGSGHPAGSGRRNGPSFLPAIPRPVAGAGFLALEQDICDAGDAKEH